VFHGALINRAILCQPHNLLARLIGDIVGVAGRLDARDSRAAARHAAHAVATINPN
jgi:hypothetical protein